MARIASLLAAMLATGLAGAAAAKTLVFCSEGSPEGFDPALYASGTTFDASSRTVYNRLVEFKPGTTELEPSLADSWDISEDSLTYVFRLRPGVKFHSTAFYSPGRELNADDVIFSFERQWRKGHPWHQYVPGANWEYFNSMGLPDLIQRIERLDDMTVRFVLNRPEAPFLANLAMDFASIMSKEYADSLRASGQMHLLNRQPLGTGPFSFVGYQQDAVIRYRAHDAYWGGRPPVDNLVFAITLDGAVRAQRLKAGECHIMAYPNPADVSHLKAAPDLTVMEREGFNIGYLAYNTRQPPFDRPAVRRALNMAINKQAIIDAVFQGTGTIAKNPIPPTLWSYNDTIQDDPYDPAAARRMLTEAGVTDLSIRIWAMPVARPYNPNARRMAELIQADFAAIGINAEIITYEWAEYLDRSRALDRDGALLLGWTGDNGDPDNFLHTLLSCDAVGGNNRAQWCNEEFDRLVLEAKTVSEQARRATLYKEAQRIFKREAPWATIAHSVVFMPMRKEVRGYVMSPLGHHRFEGVDLAP